MLSRSDALCVGGIAGGVLLTGVGATTVRLLVKNMTKKKDKWWLDPQLIVTGACTAAAAFYYKTELWSCKSTYSDSCSSGMITLAFFGLSCSSETSSTVSNVPSFLIAAFRRASSAAAAVA